MRLLNVLPQTALLAAIVATPPVAAPAAQPQDDAKVLREIYSAALRSRAAYENLADLVAKYPGRLSGSKSLEGAVPWGEAALKQAGAERTELQTVMVPHWERGAPESVQILNPDGGPGPALAAT